MRDHPHLLPVLMVGLVLAGCDEPIESPMGPEAPSIQAAHIVGHSPELNRSLASLRAATANLHNFEKADLPEPPLTPCWYFTGRGGMGYHYANPAGLIDGTVEALAPEALLYEPSPGGKLKFVAVEYLVPTAAWNEADPPSVFGVPFHDNGAGLWILHVWHFKHNPAGIFQDWNPTVSCDHAEVSEDLAP